MTRHRALPAALLLGALFAGGTRLAAAEHDIAFWRGIGANHYALPTGSDLGSLVDELAGMLGSPDPEVRDEIAYSTFASWIYQQKLLDAARLQSLSDRLLANLTAHVGERDTDTVFRRSFSALTLSVIVARDNVDPVLDAGTWNRIHAAALAYLAAEQDVRGYDERTGWMHSAAHTADLLKFLGRSRYMDAAGQGRILDAVGAKLTTAPVVFAFGEDERFARAILSLTARKDFDDREFAAWTARAKPALAERPTVAQLRAIQNWKNVLAKLEVLLSNEPQPSDGAVAARTTLRAALKTLY
jgi:hypothetical protein